MQRKSGSSEVNKEKRGKKIKDARNSGAAALRVTGVMRTNSKAQSRGVPHNATETSTDVVDEQRGRQRKRNKCRNVATRRAEASLDR